MDDPNRQLRQIFAAMPPGQHHLKLVPAEPADPALVTDRALKAAGNLGQQVIASRMAHRVVDLLEAVQVEQEHRADAMLRIGRDEDLFECLRHLEPVGEAGKRIVMRHPCRIGGRTTPLGQVIARTAKTDEIAEGIVKRAAIDRPPAFLTLGRRAHRQFAEG